ncbi:hypothetical protein FZO59_14695 [Lelliottia nimipressuralis]|uniref:Uncharacterized protein n=1 Tax=Lelliottia nimipressuralis TaxID=69220 RepID=A0ABY3P140_9ENTR|nr:hypothetical protein DAI21_11585 [Lelliottia sp. WB101]RXJ13711.1 hypothetical protein ETG88_13095 [Lelliottia nimipressuralis]TYT32487.1 hypothetical protein FZO59_14695 [Lelliottia nimipressuralis]
MISPALATSGAEAINTAARISDLNILFSFTIGAVDGLLTQYYGAVKPRLIASTPNSWRGALFAKNGFILTGSGSRQSYSARQR